MFCVVLDMGAFLVLQLVSLSCIGCIVRWMWFPN